jgi:hypothetical protein
MRLSRRADGRPAPFHTLEGLPDEVALPRNATSGMDSLRFAVISGFLFERCPDSRKVAATKPSEFGRTGKQCTIERTRFFDRFHRRITPRTARTKSGKCAYAAPNLA